MWTGLDLFLLISGLMCSVIAVYTIVESCLGIMRDRHIKALSREFAREAHARREKRRSPKDY